MKKWQDKESLKELLCHLVEFPSITGSDAEIAISEYIHMKLNDLPYFKDNPLDLQIHPTNDGRKFVTGLIRNGNSSDTVILINHMDVVDIEDYGEYKNLAFRPKDLTAEYMSIKNDLPPAVQDDLKTGEWLFGRGTMDMKAGLALQMAMMERASLGEFDGNILLLSVPDEEANSTGMMEAVEVLLEMSQTHGLHYKACLNSEPIFTRYPGDTNQYVYTGSVGKLLPGYLCFGMETHVGEPFSGINANYMAAELTRELELNTAFCEMIDGEVTPPPTNLMQKDLKEEYSVQIPHVAVTLFNMMVMERTVHEINKDLLSLAHKVAGRIEKQLHDRAAAFNKWEQFEPIDSKISVYTYQELLEKAIEQYGEAEIVRRQAYIAGNFRTIGDRDLSTRLVFDLASLCKEQGPMIVLFYSPPFYPAVSSRENSHIKQVVGEMIEYAETKHNVVLKNQHYFAGLSDLSFTSLSQPVEGLVPLFRNMPLYENGYHFPLDELKHLKIPVMNLGPLGRDPHRWTERLNIDYSFGAFPDILSVAIHKLLK
ncbi:M20/M25/M40 family metallo-hydrolase [Pseudalkalibacillus salsuginis]|uniref:M20/M25/M40 family metallo-hydrolase n=1 Tax=Pseudalkalibacillus salsuginis TaxID=2910972 RepID=UPI001F3EF034|nr:M20/M25/M40 family metallo-hydrolase [Pseudalkalibacillus salsuginis]MCF6408353.1 M20/M25/M40 family metallo-hydrolase [Pseudalkalibacillus salsuginis]